MIRPRAHAGFGQPRRQRIDFPPRRAVDDAGLPAAPGHDVEDLPLQARARQHAVDEVRPIERADELDRVLQPELRRDVAAHARRRGRRVGMQADAGKKLRSRPSCRYSGRKSWPHWLMQCASSTATNCTSHFDEPGQKPVAALAGEPLRRHVEQPVAALAQPGRHRRLLVRAERAVVERRRHAVADERVDLILHQRDERRDDDAQPLTAPAPAPGSRATCRRRSGARRPNRGARGWRPSPRAGGAGTRCSPSSARGRESGRRSRHPAGVRVGNTQTPSTTTSVPSEVAWRIALASEYSGELHHSFARSTLGKLDDDHPPGRQVAFEDLGPAASRDESAAECRDGRQHEPPVVLVTNGVFHVDDGNYVCGHSGSFSCSYPASASGCHGISTMNTITMGSCQLAARVIVAAGNR